MRLRVSLAGLALALAFLPGAALFTSAMAQDAAAPAAAPSAPTPQAAGNNPMTENKQVGDWTVRCFALKAPSPSPCDMYEELQDNATHQRVLSVSIAYIPAQDRHVAQIAVPLGVAIQQGLQIKTDSYTSPKLPFRRCDQAGCYVEMVLDPALVDGLSKAGPQASVNVFGDGGKSFALRFSLNGFAGAHDALVTLAKQKTDGAAPAAPAKKK